MLSYAEGRPGLVLAIVPVGRPAVGAPAETVARVLGGLQKVVWVLAGQATELSTAAKRRLELTCQPQSGDYVLTLGGAQLALALDWAASPDLVLELLGRVWGTIAAQEEASLVASVPDADQRKRLLGEFKRMLPRPGEAWSVSLDGVAVGPNAVRALERQLGVLSVALPAVLTVTGELLGVDFDHGTFSLRYPATRRTLTGKYAPESETWLIKHRRKSIQVDGEFALDAQQRPQSCVKALRFRSVDLAPLIFSSVPLPDGELALDPPLQVLPLLDEATGQSFQAREDSLGLFASGPTREALEAELVLQVAAMWARCGDATRGDLHADPLLARMWRRRARLVDRSAYQEA
jgi:hypothetical protein